MFLHLGRPDFAAIFREAVWDSLAVLRDSVVGYADVGQIIREAVDDALSPPDADDPDAP